MEEKKEDRVHEKKKKRAEQEGEDDEEDSKRRCQSSGSRDGFVFERGVKRKMVDDFGDDQMKRRLTRWECKRG